MIKTSRIEVESLICGNGSKPRGDCKPGTRMLSAPKGFSAGVTVRSRAVGIGAGAADIVAGMRLAGRESSCVGGLPGDSVADRFTACEGAGEAGAAAGVAGGAAVVVFGVATAGLVADLEAPSG